MLVSGGAGTPDRQGTWPGKTTSPPCHVRVALIRVAYSSGSGNADLGDEWSWVASADGGVVTRERTQGPFPYGTTEGVGKLLEDRDRGTCGAPVTISFAAKPTEYHADPPFTTEALEAVPFPCGSRRLHDLLVNVLEPGTSVPARLIFTFGVETKCVSIGSALLRAIVDRLTRILRR